MESTSSEVVSSTTNCHDQKNSGAEDSAEGRVEGVHQPTAEKTEETRLRKCLRVVEVAVLVVVMVIVTGLMALPSVFYFIPAADVEVRM